MNSQFANVLTAISSAWILISCNSMLNEVTKVIRVELFSYFSSSRSLSFIFQQFSFNICERVRVRYCRCISRLQFCVCNIKYQNCIFVFLSPAISLVLLLLCFTIFFYIYIKSSFGCYGWCCWFLRLICSLPKQYLENGTKYDYPTIIWCWLFLLFCANVVVAAVGFCCRFILNIQCAVLFLFLSLFPHP